MKYKKEVIVLKEKWNPAAHEAPDARALEMVRGEGRGEYMTKPPFPLSLDAQKRLLELIYNRKSGIITRQELIDVLFNPEDTNARARSLDAVYDRIEKIESKLERFEKLADENESLWQFLDEQKEMEGIFVGSAEEFQEEITEMMIRNMEPRGDA